MQSAESKNQGEETSSAIAERANDIMMEITAKLGVVNEVSVSLEEDTPWEANEGIRVARNNEYSVNLASSLNSKGKVSIPLEGNNPWEIFDDTNMTNKDETGADSAPDAESKDRLPDRPGKILRIQYPTT